MAQRDDQLFAQALALHQRGQLNEAEALYTRVLMANPRHAECLHYSGVAALQRGNPQQAAERIEKSLAIKERNAPAHYHLGLALAGLRRFEKAAAHNRRAIAIQPDYAEAHLNLGNALRECGQADEAIRSYQKAVSVNPNLAHGHYNLANLLAAKRDFGAANASYERALALQPNFPQAQLNYGLALLEQGRADQALAKLDAALAAAPALPEAMLGCAGALLMLNRAQEALDLVCRALDARPVEEGKKLFVECLRALPSFRLPPRCEIHLAAAIREPWVRPAVLAAVASRMLLLTGATSLLAARLTADEDVPFTQRDLEALSADELLLAVLETIPVTSLLLERLLAAVRRALLDIAPLDFAAGDALLRLACALARQCFINEYVQETGAEQQRVADALRDRLLAALDAKVPVAPLSLATVACHFPLESLDRDAQLLAGRWPPPADAVVIQQIREPLAERELRASMPRLTVIEDGVSAQVREQYEQNPYPRWTRFPRSVQPVPLVDYIRNRFRTAGFSFGYEAGVDILVAGCGTGQEPLDLAIGVAAAKILAVDLSLSSLAHAKRKSVELGVANVEYGQADILRLPDLGKTFDLVTSRGVLHHMRDPFAAWRGLMKLVKPGGVMMVGLYSQVARRNINLAREALAARGFEATADGIRAARNFIAALPDDSPVKAGVAITNDFFSLSECRDLIFHVQEHQFTIPQIGDFIAHNGVRFLGFDLGPREIGRYRARFPGDPAGMDLDNWHVFETENPDTFLEMYQFAVQVPRV